VLIRMDLCITMHLFECIFFSTWFLNSTEEKVGYVKNMERQCKLYLVMMSGKSLFHLYIYIYIYIHTETLTNISVIWNWCKPFLFFSRYLHFDFHHVCGHIHFDRLSILYDQISDFLERNGYGILLFKFLTI